jgi:hypothetical protein
LRIPDIQTDHFFGAENAVIGVVAFDVPTHRAADHVGKLDTKIGFGLDWPNIADQFPVASAGFQGPETFFEAPLIARVIALVEFDGLVESGITELHAFGDTVRLFHEAGQAIDRGLANPLFFQETIRISVLFNGANREIERDSVQRLEEGQGLSPGRRLSGVARGQFASGRVQSLA